MAPASTAPKIDKALQTLELKGAAATKKLPKPSKSITSKLVTFYPMVMTLVAIVGLLWILLRALPRLFSSLLALDILTFIGTAGLVCTFLLIALSVPGLYSHLRGAWKLNFLASLLTVSGAVMLRELNEISWFIIGFVLWQTLLFGIRPYFGK